MGGPLVPPVMREDSKFVFILLGLDLLADEILPRRYDRRLRTRGVEPIANKSETGFQFRKCQKQHRQIAPIGTRFRRPLAALISDELAGDKFLRRTTSTPSIRRAGGKAKSGRKSTRWRFFGFWI